MTPPTLGLGIEMEVGVEGAASLCWKGVAGRTEIVGVGVEDMFA